jgi:hypothetical protein
MRYAAHVVNVAWYSDALKVLLRAAYRVSCKLTMCVLSILQSDLRGVLDAMYTSC